MNLFLPDIKKIDRPSSICSKSYLCKKYGFNFDRDIDLSSNHNDSLVC